jgi:hypothetical protein
MTEKRDLILIKLAFVTLFVGVLALSVLLAPAAQAGLPARNTPTPVREQHKQQESKSKDNGPLGAWIELQAQSAPAKAWSMVQWQNELDDWYDVEGWQGSLDGNGYQRWWVHEKDFGNGPFRWVVRQGKDGPVLGISQAFNLPGGTNEAVRVTVSVPSD